MKPHESSIQSVLLILLPSFQLSELTAPSISPRTAALSPNSSINSGSASETNARAVSIAPIIASHMNCWPGIWILIPTSYSYRIVSNRTCRRAVNGSSTTHHVCYDTTSPSVFSVVMESGAICGVLLCVQSSTPSPRARLVPRPSTYVVIV